MKFIATFAVFMALIVPTAPASATTISESVTILQTIVSELQLIQTQLAYINSDDYTGYVAGATTNTGLVVFINGEESLTLSTATKNAAIDACYVYATDSLIAGDDYTCEFDGNLIFDSVVDAAY